MRRISDLRAGDWRTESGGVAWGGLECLDY